MSESELLLSFTLSEQQNVSVNESFFRHKLTPRRRLSFSDRNHFDRVPDHFILGVLWYLNKYDLTNTMNACRRFKYIGVDPKLWKFLNLQGRPISESALHTIIDRKIRILRLFSSSIEGSVSESWYNFSTASRSHLTHLDLSQAKLSSEVVLKNLLHRCRKLKALSLEGCKYLNEDSCVEISKNNHLEILDMIHVANVPNEGMKKILISCTRLKEISLGWANLDDNVITTICNFAPASIQKLNLSGLRELPAANDTNLGVLIKNCYRLEELNLSDNNVITERLFESLKRLKRLRILSLSRCYGIEPYCFVEFADMNLYSLNVHGTVTPEGYDELEKRLYPTIINRSDFCYVARPTVGESLSSIWGQRTRDLY